MTIKYSLGLPRGLNVYLQFLTAQLGSTRLSRSTNFRQRLRGKCAPELAGQGAGRLSLPFVRLRISQFSTLMWARGLSFSVGT